VTFEEVTSAAWLQDLLKPHVTHLVVCDPRKSALLKDGSKSDRIDARKLGVRCRASIAKDCVEVPRLDVCVVDFSVHLPGADHLLSWRALPLRDNGLLL
jgi:hypothetical protein